MGQSHIKRRQRERPIRLHRRTVDRELGEICRDLGRDLSGTERRKLVDEVVRLASPWAFPGIDAVLPAERMDLIRGWLVYRLVTPDQTPLDIERTARSIAPAPDDDFRSGLYFFGDPTSAEVAAAHASRHRRCTHRKESLVTS